MGATVALSWGTLIMAGNVGVMRHANALRKQLVSKDAHHFDSQEGHVAGAIAECAVAQHFNVFWDPAVGITHASQVNGDVGKIECRSTHLKHGKLIVHDYSFDDRAYLLVLAYDSPTFALVGWLWGREGKKAHYWKDDAPRPAYFIPQSVLHPFETLPPPGVPACVSAPAGRAHAGSARPAGRVPAR